MIDRTRFDCSILLSCLLACIAAQAADGPVDTDIVKALGERKDMRLASEGDSAATRFMFQIDISARGVEPLRLIAQRDQDSLAVLCCSLQNHVYFYARNGLVVKVDSMSPGQILIAGGAEFSLTDIADAAGEGTKFNIALNAQGKSRVIWDVASLLQSLDVNGYKVVVNDDGRKLSVETKGATVELVVSADKSRAFPVDGMIVRTHSGAVLRFHDITLSPPAGQGILGHTAEQFAALPVEKRIGRWTPELAAKQAPVTPAGFWADERNVTAGRAMAALFADILPAATQPAAATAPASAPAPRLDQLGLRVDQMRQGMESILRGQAAALGDIQLTPQQRQQTEDLLRKRQQGLRVILERMEGRVITSAEALKELSATLELTEALKGVLDAQQMAEYARRWLDANAGKAQPDSVEEMFSILIAESAKLELSPLQRSELGQLCTAQSERWSAIKVGFQLGEVDRAQVQAATAKMGQELLAGLRRILNDEQYKDLESLIAKHRPPPTTLPGRPMPGTGV